MSNSSLSVSIVFWVSCLNYSLFSICVFRSFRSFLLSSSSCLHFKALRKMFSLLFVICTYWPKFCYWELAPCGNWFALFVSAWLSSFNTRLRRFLIYSTYCSNASLFFSIILFVFSLQDSMSSRFLKLNAIKELTNSWNNLKFLKLTWFIESHSDFRHPERSVFFKDLHIVPWDIFQRHHCKQFVLILIIETQLRFDQLVYFVDCQLHKLLAFIGFRSVRRLNLMVNYEVKS